MHVLLCNIRPCSILYTDDAIKESILYAAIFLVLLILTVLLCAVIFYKLRKRTVEGNENARPVEPTDGNENARLVNDRDEECQVRKV